jgi:hypothetical protein
MLSKVTKDNVSFGTYEIQKFGEKNQFDVIQDNLNGLLLVKTNNIIYVYNYLINRKHDYFRIKIEFNNKFFFKQIDSFEQNNIKEAFNIRKTVLYFLKDNNSTNILGIGGEYYIYFSFLNYNKYYGISNHKSIIEDADYNLSYLNKINYKVDYNDLRSYPNIDKLQSFDIIINVVNIHENIIKYICKLNCKKIIIVTCKPLEKKIKMLNKYLKLKKIEHILNINSLITICEFVKN